MRPMAARRSGGTEACVIDAGWQMSVSTPPRLSASDISLTRLQHAARVLEAPDVERQHPAESAHLALRQLVLGMVWQSRIEHTFHRRVFRQELRQRQPVDVVLRHAQRQRLGAAQHQERVERAQNRALRVLDELQPLEIVVVHADDDAADAVAVSVEVLRRAVHDQVGAELDRPLHARAGERVVDDEPSRRALCASADAAARSVRRMTGLVGVSMNTIRVSGRIACSTSSSDDVST